MVPGKKKNTLDDVSPIVPAPIVTSPIPTTVPVSRLPKIIGFDSLARCGDEVWIENNGQIYRLRKTKLGKLILTK